MTLWSSSIVSPLDPSLHAYLWELTQLLIMIFWGKSFYHFDCRSLRKKAGWKWLSGADQVGFLIGTCTKCSKGHCDRPQFTLRPTSQTDTGCNLGVARCYTGFQLQPTSTPPTTTTLPKPMPIYSPHNKCNPLCITSSRPVSMGLDCPSAFPWKGTVTSRRTQSKENCIHNAFLGS